MTLKIEGLVVGDVGLTKKQQLHPSATASMNNTTSAHKTKATTIDFAVISTAVTTGATTNAT